MGFFDNAINAIRAERGLPPLTEPTPEERAASAAEEAARQERWRRQEEERLARLPRYDLGDGRYARSRRLAGRCANGAERGKGTRYHCVPETSETALCGATWGNRSVGWGDVRDEPVSCPRCLARLARQGGRLLPAAA